MDYSMPGSSVLCCLPEFAQIHVHWVGNASNHLTLCHPLLLLSSVFPSIRVFTMSQLFSSGCQSIGALASASVLPLNIPGWFTLGLTALISLKSKRVLRVFSSPTVKEASIILCSVFFMVQLSHLYMNYWKNQSFDYMDLYWQNDISVF